MKRLGLFVILFLFSAQSIAQAPDSPTILTGFGPYILGTPKSALEDSILFVNAITWNGKRDYIFVRRLQSPIEYGGIVFSDLLLTFDQSLKLSMIQLTKFYSKTNFDSPETRAKQDKQLLYNYLCTAYGKDGKRKNKFNHLRSDGYEWNFNNCQVWMYLQKGFKPPGRMPSYFLNLVWQIPASS